MVKAVKRDPASKPKPKLTISEKDVENFGNEADGNKPTVKMVTTGINFTEPVLFKLEDVARENKRTKSGLRSVSALVRKAVEEYFINNS